MSEGRASKSVPPAEYQAANPSDSVEGAKPGAVYAAFSDEELRDFLETLGWLKAAEKSVDFWDNPADAVYDTL